MRYRLHQDEGNLCLALDDPAECQVIEHSHSFGGLGGQWDAVCNVELGA